MIVLLLAALLQGDLPDFSRAGYRAGEAEIPRAAARVTVRSFEELTAEVARGGVIELPEGQFEWSGVLTVFVDGTVIRGAGADKTVLVCAKSLTELRGGNPGWSWGGGMIEVAPAAGITETVADVTAADGVALSCRFEKPPVAGEWLQLTWTNDRGADTLLDHLYGGVVAREHMGRELRESDAVRVREWVRVEAVEDGAVRIEHPLRLDVRPEWNVKLVRRPFVTEFGIEGVTFRFPETKYPGHLNEKGYNAVCVQAAVNGWVRDVRTIDADSGIFVNDSKHVTVDGFEARGRYMHHALAASWSSDCLFTNWRIEAPHRHGTTISWAAHGIVFSRGWGRQLAMDAHRAASFENLHTDITIDHGDAYAYPLRSGGSLPRGPHSARRNVYWNVAHVFPPGEGPVRIGPIAEWPLGVFVGWHGNREIELKTVEKLMQRVEDLNREPEIRDLHLHQRR